MMTPHQMENQPLSAALSFPFDPQSAAGRHADAYPDCLSDTSSMGISLWGKCRHDPRKTLAEFHDWMAHDVMFCAAYSRLLTSIGQRRLSEIHNALVGQFIAAGITKMFTAGGSHHTVELTRQPLGAPRSASVP